MSVSERLKVGLGELKAYFRGDFDYDYIEELKHPDGDYVLDLSRLYTRDPHKLGTLRSGSDGRPYFGCATEDEFRHLKGGDDLPESVSNSFRGFDLRDLNKTQLETLLAYHQQRLEDLPDVERPDFNPRAPMLAAILPLVAFNVAVSAAIPAYKKASDLQDYPEVTGQIFKEEKMQDCWNEAANQVAAQLKDSTEDYVVVKLQGEDLAIDFPTQEQFKAGVNQCYQEVASDKAFAQHVKDVNANAETYGVIAAIMAATTMSLVAKSFLQARKIFDYNSNELERDILRRNAANLERELQTHDL